MGKKGGKSGQSKEAVKGGKNCSKEPFSKKGGQSKECVRANQSKEAVKTVSTRSATDTKQSKSTDEEGMINFMARALSHNHWFHGSMPRDEIEDLLKAEGEFLLRRTEVEGKPRFAISVYKKGTIKHILLHYKDGMWNVRDIKKKTLTELINAHVEGKVPVMSDGTKIVKGAARPDFYILHEHIDLKKRKVPVMSDGTKIVKGAARPDFYILHEHIDLKKRLGGGAFGEVYIGIWKKSDTESIEVAVKRLKGMMHKKERIELVREAKLMRRFDHQNIVKIYGVAPQEEPMMIVLELASGGALNGHLQKNPDIAVEKLVSYCKDGARGMCYLASRNVIHRDIAARNCLLGKNDELKISDFGLSVADRSLVKMDKLKSMPIKWLAPECLRKGEFTKKTDVWSFGILMWEIFTRCKTDPFPGETNLEAKKKILSGKQPMQVPPNTPPIPASVMEMCFIQDPAERPDFEGIFKILSPDEKPPINIDNMFETYSPY
uniref:Tyrosine-protein kinase n=2 Tax=Panagrolaimus sp. JU765 TaxID=591449 RepID=A0AC34QM36_9BILA